MNRCTACGCAISQGHEIVHNGRPYHETHVPVDDHIKAFEDWTRPHLTDGKLVADVTAAYLQTYPARTVPLLIALKEHHDRHTTRDPTIPLQGAEEDRGSRQGEEHS